MQRESCASDEPLFHIVLVEPEIPPNTGNVARLCAAMNCMLHLVGPLGFKLDDSALKRAGMDYWKHVQWRYHETIEEVLELGRSTEANAFCIETSGQQSYVEAPFRRGDLIFFGRETKGLRESQLRLVGGQVLRIPMLCPEVRSLNLSTCVALVLGEALRRIDFGQR